METFSHISLIHHHETLTERSVSHVFGFQEGPCPAIQTNVVFYKSGALNISFWAIPAIYDLKKEQPTTGIDALDGQ